MDNAINVLISAGVSSPSLRRAAELGVKIEGAGHAEVAVPKRQRKAVLLVPVASEIAPFESRWPGAPFVASLLGPRMLCFSVLRMKRCPGLDVSLNGTPRRDENKQTTRHIEVDPPCLIEEM